MALCDPMVSYSRLLNEITKRFGSALSVPGGEKMAADPAQEVPAEPSAGSRDLPIQPAGHSDSDPGPRTREIDSEYLARVFRDELDAAQVKPRGKEPPGQTAKDGGEGPGPFRNHAELLKFASGLIADIEASFKAAGRIG